MSRARDLANLGAGVPDPFNPVSVSGATPSLDVGNYNFFDHGTLTANITLGFTNVPTNAKWSYSFKPALTSGAWDVSTASFTQGFSISAQEASIQSVHFKPDGTKMYIMGVSGDDVNEYNLSTAWDISTATFLQLFSVSSQDLTPIGLFFKPDGTKMYITGNGFQSAIEYDLSTAWDVTSASFLQDFDVSAQDIYPVGLFFKPDGSRMYIAGQNGSQVLEYEIGSASTVTLPASVENSPAQTLTLGTNITYEFFTMDGGTTVTLIGEEVV